MKPGPLHAARILAEEMEISASPRPAAEWLAEICISQSWFRDPNEARERAEGWEGRFLSELRRELRESRELGRHSLFAFNTSSEYMVQGAAFAEPHDPPDVKLVKSRAAQHSSYVAALSALTPRHFEAMCAGILAELGVDSPTLTKYSADEGIDFFGKLRLEKFITPAHMTAGLERQMNVWMIGQAKHYKANAISTFEIRDLVGAVELARGKAFSTGEAKYPDLAIRVCDPVFYMLITTGRLSSATWRLLERSGVTGMDGQMVAAFLAQHGIGMKAGQFDRAVLTRWLNRYLFPQPSTPAP